MLSQRRHYQYCLCRIYGNQVISKRFVKKQSMQWTQRGAHLLLQTRTWVLNDDLEGTFREWYPHFRPQEKKMPAFSPISHVIWFSREFGEPDTSPMAVHEGNS